jgi:flavin reductase (DIM6/NTAB) family NADH-FMN oxidoreductase RutF
MYLPAALKRRIRAVPQWSAVALQPPQNVVQAQLVGNGRTIDTTTNNVVAALRPLTLALGMNEQIDEAAGSGAQPELRFVDRETGRELGQLSLRRSEVWQAAAAQIGLFEVIGGDHRCIRWPHRSWNRWLQERAARKNPDPNNFSMTPAAIQQSMIFYICPRPVVLVSVDDGQHSNIFPMDLIGPIATNYFSLALRSTSQSVPTMKSARKIAISDVGARDHQIAYRLGVHHKNVKVDWQALPFAVGRSQEFSLPIPSIALRVRELEVLDHRTVGSHTLFLTRIVSDRALRDGVRFFHTSGVHQYLRARNGCPFPLAADADA